MTDCQDGPDWGAEYGKWEEGALRYLIRAEAHGRDLRGSTRQSRLAMEISKKTGCSYSWAWREVERALREVAGD